MARARADANAGVDRRALYRQGLAQSHRGELRSLTTLAGAHDVLDTAGDREGAGLAAATLLFTGHALQNFRRFAANLAVVDALRATAPVFSSRDDELVFLTGALCGMIWLRPLDPGIDACVDRVMQLIELDIDVNTRFAAGRLVLYYTDPRENRELGHRVYGTLEPLVDDPHLTPHRLGRWLLILLRVPAMGLGEVLLRRTQDRARALLEQHRDAELTATLLASELEQRLRTGDVPRAKQLVGEIAAVSDESNLVDLGRLAWFNTRLAMVEGDAEAALFHATRGRRYAEELELPPPMLGVRTAYEAHARLMRGDFDGARDYFRRTIELVAVLHGEEMRDMIRMVDAYEAYTRGRSSFRDLLQSAFAAPRARQFYDSFDTHPAFGATMCALALEHGVEVEFARRIVEVQGFPPPANAGSAWPWPVHVASFGRFELRRSGTPLDPAGKAQKKPLELLKALVAFGARDVDKTRLAEALWPDSETDANAALDMAISRLRKLLALPEAIRIEEGKVGLSEAHVYVDLWAFDRDVEALQATLRSVGEIDDVLVASLGQRLLATYRGAFLDNEEPKRWLLAARDRWRSRFLRSLADAGRHWERRDRWGEAIELYERGIEVDTLAEELYRKLMRCHLQQGNAADAARVYRRCREMLSIQLGIVPSPDTEALFRSIYDAADRPKQ
jgi:LuxR family maltose regulon positive regulatory protein